MACPFLDEGSPTRCRAVEGTLTPSVFEREHYCRSSGESCPTFDLARRERRAVSQASYFALWIPSAAECRPRL